MEPLKQVRASQSLRASPRAATFLPVLSPPLQKLKVTQVSLWETEGLRGVKYSEGSAQEGEKGLGRQA